MQRYGRIFSDFWTSPDIVGLSAESKCLAAYLLSCNHSNMIGCFRLPIAYVVEDLRMGCATVSEGFNNLCCNGFLTYDSALAWVLISKFLKWNRIENPNQGKAAAKLVEQVPQNSSVYAPLVSALRQYPGNLPAALLNRFETVPEPYRNPQQQLHQQLHQKKTPPRVKREGARSDPRHSEFKAAIEDYWASRNAENEMPWDGSEAKALGDYLKANPGLTTIHFAAYLRNRFRSEVNHAERPRIWVANATSYAGGPLDRFGKPLGVGNGKGKGDNNLAVLRDCLGQDQDSPNANGDLSARGDGQAYTFPLLEASRTGTA